MVASFSNGDPPLTLFGDGVTNIYSESWQPGVVQPNMSVTIRANAPNYPEASLVLTGNVEPNVAPVSEPGWNGEQFQSATGRAAGSRNGGRTLSARIWRANQFRLE